MIQTNGLITSRAEAIAYARWAKNRRSDKAAYEDGTLPTSEYRRISKQIYKRANTLKKAQKQRINVASCATSGRFKKHSTAHVNNCKEYAKKEGVE